MSSTESLLEILYKETERGLRLQFLELSAQVKDSIDEEVATNLPLQEKASKDLSSFSDEVLAAVLFAGNKTGQWIAQNTKSVFRFSSIDENVINIMREYGARLVQGISSSQRAAIQEAIISSFVQGINPKETAVRVKQSIGLTQRQVQAINNYRRMLESGDLAALNSPLRDKRFDASVKSKALTQEKIDKMVDYYSKKQLQYRATVIARTETLRSINEGMLEAFRQSVMAGVLKENELQRTWITAQDERVRGSHKNMQGQKRPLNQPFVSGRGNALRYPGDPQAPGYETIQCRCLAPVRIL